MGGELAELAEAWQEAYAAYRRATATEQADPTNRAAVLVVRAWQSLGEVARAVGAAHRTRWLVQATLLADLPSTLEGPYEVPEGLCRLSW